MALLAHADAACGLPSLAHADADAASGSPNELHEMVQAAVAAHRRRIEPAQPTEVAPPSASA